MKVTQEKLPASQIGLEIEVTPEMSSQAYEKVLQKFMRSANIQGFRRGKVPRHVLIQQLGPNRIKATAIEDLLESSLQKALEQEKIAALGNYKIRSSFDELIQAFEPGQPFTFSASVDVAPKATLATYKGLSVQAEEVPYDPKSVEEVLKSYQERSATLVPVEDRPSQDGDIAVIDFVGRIAAEEEGGDPVEFPGGSATDFQVDLVPGQFIAGFIEGIIGMAVGETKDVETLFPEDYGQAELAGKAATFTITLKELKTRELPELDDDFAQDVSEFETMEEFRASLEKNYQESADRKTKENKHAALLDALVEHLDVEIPETLIQEESNFMLTQTVMNLSRQGMDVKKLFTPELVERLRQQSRPEAVLRLKRTMVLSEVAEKEGIAVDDTELQERIDKVIAENPDQDFDRDRLKEALQEEIMQEKVLAFLEEQNTVELVPEGSLTSSDDIAEAEFESDASDDIADPTEAADAVVDAVAVDETEAQDAPDEEAEDTIKKKSSDKSE